MRFNKPFLPPLKDYYQYLKEIWERNWLTNEGPLVKEFEKKLKQYLEVPHVSYVCNGTMALQIAIRALEIEGEVITTPFSYVATTSSIVWESCDPVFADINPETLNIDPSKIEEKISPRTKAIVAAHIFGNPCELEKIQKIAAENNLKLIYDGAHSFGVKYKGESVYKYGDISIMSFHANKLFHSVEGGGIVADKSELSEKISLMKNFGFGSNDKIENLGINAKNSELHAAFALASLKYIPGIIEKRRTLSERYDAQLAGSNLSFQKINKHSDYNYAYYPVIFSSEEQLLTTTEKLAENKIQCRRYFYPSLSKLRYLKSQSVPICEDISTRILCLPLYYDLEANDIDRVCEIICE